MNFLVSKKGKEFLVQLRDCQLLNKDSAPWIYSVIDRWSVPSRTVQIMLSLGTVAHFYRTELLRL
jgi:hypothetical protein